MKIRPVNKSLPARPVSVIIAAHNESSNLRKHIPAVLSLQYPDFEVIVVLDRSDDDSKAYLDGIGDRRLRVLEITETPPGWSPKKWALTAGIREAANEHLAFTDADCQPGPGWLEEINRCFTGKTELVLGLSPYFVFPGWLNRLIQFETTYAVFQYIGLAVRGLPYMGVGRNLAYTRTFFEKNGGFEAFRQRLSGDDDLLVNAYAIPETTGVMIAREGLVYSDPKQTWKAWFRQKLRHVSSSSGYSAKTKIILGIFHLSHAGFYLFGGFVLANDLTGWPFFALYIIRIFISGVLRSILGESWGSVVSGIILFWIFCFYLHHQPFQLTNQKASMDLNTQSSKIRKKTAILWRQRKEESRMHSDFA
ncbi:MAG: glycosyltransferase [Bacteroidia bacterium]